MSDVEQDTAEQVAEQPATLADSRDEQPQRGSSSQQSRASEREPERKASLSAKDLEVRQKKLDAHRSSVLKGREKLLHDLDRQTGRDALSKRMAIRRKIETFDQELVPLDAEQASLDRDKAALAREAQLAKAEALCAERRQLSAENLGDQIRRDIKVLADHYSKWKTSRDRDRVIQDVLRGLAPERMGESPYYSWSSGVETGLQSAIDTLLAECRRSEQMVAARAAQNSPAT